MCDTRPQDGGRWRRTLPKDLDPDAWYVYLTDEFPETPHLAWGRLMERLDFHWLWSVPITLPDAERFRAMSVGESILATARAEMRRRNADA